jgi:type VI secretion system protein ImpM
VSIPTTGLGGIQPITAPIPGWYGKLPCLGDFASRRLPREFIENWDAWLQRSIAASRRELGERWLDLFLTSPMWRFALAPGACGPDAWAGLLLPSVDKVGRYFPLTIAVPLERCDADLTEVFAAHSWYADIEKVALAALSIDYAPSELEAALAQHPFLSERYAPAQSTAVDDLASWLKAGSAEPRAFLLPRGKSIAAVMDATARGMLETSTAGRTFWWCISDETGATETHCSAGLPPESYFTVLLGGARASEPIPADPLKAFGFGEPADDAAAAR